ncbi:MAG: DUF2924 domain-containing protein [Mesorhizobium sp.]|nr:DUF2924 domain-containing protein [Mesorhizobium sp.]
MREAQLAHEIEALERLDLEGLRGKWLALFGTPPPLRSVELLRLSLAWRMQASVLGGLDRDTRRQLQRRGRIRVEGLELGVGAKIRREWQGVIVEGIVEQDGFRWQDTTYRSLSAAASAIAGSRWNGPRFFGLRQPAS